MAMQVMERRFSCEYCHVEFDYSSGLNRHLKSRKHALLVSMYSAADTSDTSSENEEQHQVYV